MNVVTIDAKGMHYTPLNKKIRQVISEGAKEIVLENVMGQRFIADGLCSDVKITVNGVPGGDLGIFMNGPTCVVNGNADHAPGNTMDNGTIVIHGSTGDTTAHSMRGGKIFVRDDIGYRGGIHMKQYLNKKPVLVVGHMARAFLGEYMAGGVLILLRRGEKQIFDERGIGSGIHGGEIYIRGEVAENCLGVGAKMQKCTSSDIEIISSYIKEFCEWFGYDTKQFLDSDYTCIKPAGTRPFAGKYTWE